MKKVLFILMTLLCLVSCEKKTTPELNVERITATDKQKMFTDYGSNYIWYESCIRLKDYLDENCDGTISGIANVFQVQIPDSTGVNTMVISMSHTLDTAAIDIKHGFWIEDFPITEDSMITYKEAFDIMMAVNYPKPHSKNCILRKPIGPYPCNPQYVFGNIQSQIWIDAVTGKALGSNPAFSPETVNKPLGEWP